MGMDEDNFELDIDNRSCKELNVLKDHISNYKIESGLPDSNIFEQKGGSYKIPFNVLNHIGVDAMSNEFEEVLKDLSETSEADAVDFKIRSEKTPMDIFFEHLEQVRIAGAITHFSEKQYFKISCAIQKLSEPGIVDEFDTLIEPDDIPVMDITGTEESKVYRDVTHSGIELDLDIYQKVPELIINPMLIQRFIHVCSSLFKKYLILDGDLCETINTLTTYAVVLGKPSIVSVTHKTYGNCYKDSYHIRFPGIKVTKAFKRFLVNELKTNYMHKIFDGLRDLISPPKTILDEGSVSFPSMLLGSCKASGTVPHEFKHLYKLDIGLDMDIINILRSYEFDIDDTKAHQSKVHIRNANTGRLEAVKISVKGSSQYNLCYETSLNYENPKGLIRKRNFDVRDEYRQGIEEIDIMRSVNEKGKRMISDDDINLNDEAIQNLIHRDHEAAYLYKILGILKRERASEFVEWRKIICLLAKKGTHYLPLAIWFSMRCPDKYDGIKAMKQMWSTAINDSKSEDFDEAATTKILNAWAKADNKTEYMKIQNSNTFSIMNKRTHTQGGKLNEQDFAQILKSMFSGKYVTDSRKIGQTISKIWYEFVYPEDESPYIKGELYKWRRLDYPDSLDNFIAEELPDFVQKYINYLDDRIEKNTAAISDAESESAAERIANNQKHYASLKSALMKAKNRLGQVAFITNIIRRSAQLYLGRGFERTLDISENHIGVYNGVLQLHPLKLIQSFHEIPISRSCGSNFKPYNPDDPYIAELEKNIKLLICNDVGEFDEDTYTYIMMFLASSLDGRKKQPIFFLWLGEGGNGKSFLLEMHIQTMATVIGNGYGNKINVSFFTGTGRDNGGGPDTEKMTMKNARFTYCSESDAGAELKMSKIKEFTGGETIAGNDKNEKQDQFRINSVFAFCTNHDPRLKGLDYGTLRRIVGFRFRRVFKHDPDESNPLEHKINEKFIKTVPDTQEYREAYLAILSHYYTILMEKYGGSLENAKSPNIIKDTKEYISEQNSYSKFVYEQLIHIGKTVPTTDIQIKNIPIQEVITKFRKWHIETIDSNVANSDDIKKALKQTSLNKFVLKGYGNKEYIREHIWVPTDKEFDMKAYIASCIEAEPIKTNITEDLQLDNIIDDFDLPISVEPISEPIPEIPETLEIPEIPEMEGVGDIPEIEPEIPEIPEIEEMREMYEPTTMIVKSQKIMIPTTVNGKEVMVEVLDDLDWD
jgi:hypothetical protein